MDIINEYRSMDAEKRVEVIFQNYATFPKIIQKEKRKLIYKIKSDQEFIRSHSRDELGVRVQTSGTSDPTSQEAITNVTIKEVFETGVTDKSLFKGFEDASSYEADIRMIYIMRLDFELLQDIIEGLDECDARIIKQFLVEGLYMKEIADMEGKTYEAIKKRLDRIRTEIREEMVECMKKDGKED